ncbi:MAG TPA: AMP-binding protein, partial [Thermoanaerobaculia bacterium]|nr:AMP-binding protein [Thermoanaerobaculia bacterium]
MGRLAGQEDLVVGSPIANRNQQEIEGLIGFFVNTLALRADLGQAASFGDLLRQVREGSLGAYAHQDLPFEKLVDELQPDRDLSRSPLFQVAFALQNAPLPAADLGGVPLTPVELPGEVAKFDLSFVLTEALGGADGGLWGALQYATDLFEAPTALRLTRHFRAILESLAARPEAPLAAADLLSPGERQQLLHEWNDTRAPVLEETLHGLFLARAAEQPDAVAVVWEETHLTYGDLAARAARLGRLLRDRGIRPGRSVAIWMERSPEMIAAVLGALEAGGHYLPLDAAWPAERVEAILAGSRTPVVVAGAGQLPAAREFQWRLPVTDLVCLDVATPRPPAEPFDAAEVQALWDFVAEQATDRETAGGFVSSYTGQPFSAAEVDQYRDRVLGLAAPWLVPGARVLEIGSGAGLLLWEMAPRVARAVGLDPSPLTQERNRAHAAAQGLENVELPVGFAHEIDDRVEGEFDLVVLASTVQFFPGPAYLEEIVAKALARLAPGGALLIADVPDARRREEFQRSLAAAGSPGKPGQGRERWWDEDQFRALGAELPEMPEIPEGIEVVVEKRPEGSEGTAGFANELRFRYDVLLTRGQRGRRGTPTMPAVPAQPPEKRLWTGWHVARQSALPVATIPRGASPDDLAYVIHTSGSTGVPKGIAVTHRAAAHRVVSTNATFGVGREDRLLFVTSLGFDLSVY